MFEKILFRAKRKDNNDWCYGYYVKLKNDKNEEISYRIYTGYSEREDEELFEEFYEVIPETVGLYIEKEDKNQKSIYSGDILEYDTKARFVVVFDEMMIMCPKDKMEFTSPGYFGILIGDKTRELCPLGNTQELCKIIGNVHDNSELLDDKEVK